MKSYDQAGALTALGHEGRLAVFRLLARRAPHGVRPADIAGALGLKASTLSVYLATLARAGLVTSERAGKAVLYRVDLERTGRLIDYLVSDCCRGRPELCEPLAAHALDRLEKGASSMSDTRYTVLFICTGNSARSIFAEAILRDLGGSRFHAHSAGTSPRSQLNPNALEVLTQAGHDISVLRSKNVAEFQAEDAPRLDFVFTVCDRAANEECPPWPGQPITAHWGMPDPVKAEGTEAERALAFRQAYTAMRRRLESFVELPIETLDRMTLQKKLDAIGTTADTSAQAG